MRLPSYYRFCSRVRTISGHNSLSRLPALLQSLNASKPIIITDRGVQKAGLVKLVQAPLDAASIVIPIIYTDVPSDSDVDTVNTIAHEYTKHNCDSIIAIGGGSVLDTAKGVNIIVSTTDMERKYDIREFSGAGTIPHRLLPYIAIPTTAGTGSEVTIVAVIKDHAAKRKLLFTSYFLQPDIAILDPEMTLTLPPFLTAATGMDALTHAIEAYTCLGKNPISDGMAIQAIALIMEHLEETVSHPDNPDGRLALAVGSNLAGQAFSNSMVGMIHTIGHTVGSICGVHHGACMSILLPYGLSYNYHKITRELEELAPFIDHAVSAFEVIEHLQDLNTRLFIATNGAHKTRLHDVLNRNGSPAVRPEHLSLIARASLGDGSNFYNPEQLTYEDILHVLEAAYWGYPLDRALIQQGHA